MKFRKMGRENKTAFYNFISTLVVQGVTFITIPIFTSEMGSAQYGVYSIVYSWVVIIACFMGAKVDASIGIGRYDFKDDYFDFRSSVLLLGTIIGFFFVVLSVIFKKYICEIIGFEYYTVLLILFTAFGQFIINFTQSALIYEKRAGLNMIYSISLAFSTTGLSLILIRFSELQYRYLGRMVGIAIPTILFAFISWIYIFRKKITFIKSKYSKYAIRLGMPIVFHALSLNVLTQSDRIMMNKMRVSDNEIGIYSVYYSLTMILSVVLNALNVTWCPYYYDDLLENNKEKLVSKYNNYIQLFTILTVGFLLVIREVGKLVTDKEYWAGLEIIPILAVSVYFTFMYQFLINIEFFLKRNKLIATGTVLAAFLNIILNYVLIPDMRIYGASVATAMAYFLLLVFHFLIFKLTNTNFYYFDIKKFMFPILCIFYSIFCFYYFREMWIVRWIMAILIGCYEIIIMCRRKSIF